MLWSLVIWSTRLISKSHKNPSSDVSNIILTYISFRSHWKPEEKNTLACRAWMSNYLDFFIWKSIFLKFIYFKSHPSLKSSKNSRQHLFLKEIGYFSLEIDLLVQKRKLTIGEENEWQTHANIQPNIMRSGICGIWSPSVVLPTIIITTPKWNDWMENIASLLSYHEQDN